MRFLRVAFISMSFLFFEKTAISKTLYVVGDLHGDCNLFETIYKRVIKVIDDKNKWIAGDATVVQLGDIVDRARTDRLGMQLAPYEDEGCTVALIKGLTSIKAQALRHGGDAKLMFGNHEIMNFIKYFSYVSPAEFDEAKRETGLDDKNQARFDLFHETKYLREDFSKFEVITQVGDWIFTHGGVESGALAKMFDVYPTFDSFNQKAQEILNGYKTKLPDMRRGTLEENVGLLDQNRSFLWYRAFGQTPHSVPCDNWDATIALLRAKGISATHMGIAHSVQLNNGLPINGVCPGTDKVPRVWRTDAAMSRAMTDASDPDFQNYEKNYLRMPQALKIALNEKMETTEIKILSILGDHGTQFEMNAFYPGSPLQAHHAGIFSSQQLQSFPAEATYIRVGSPIVYQEPTHTGSAPTKPIYAYIEGKSAEGFTIIVTQAQQAARAVPFGKIDTFIDADGLIFMLPKGSIKKPSMSLATLGDSAKSTSKAPEEMPQASAVRPSAPAELADPAELVDIPHYLLPTFTGELIHIEQYANSIYKDFITAVSLSTKESQLPIINRDFMEQSLMASAYSPEPGAEFLDFLLTSYFKESYTIEAMGDLHEIAKKRMAEKEILKTFFKKGSPYISKESIGLYDKIIKKQPKLKDGSRCNSGEYRIPKTPISFHSVEGYDLPKFLSPLVNKSISQDMLLQYACHLYEDYKNTIQRDSEKYSSIARRHLVSTTMAADVIEFVEFFNNFILDTYFREGAKGYHLDIERSKKEFTKDKALIMDLFGTHSLNLSEQTHRLFREIMQSVDRHPSHL